MSKQKRAEELNKLKNELRVMKASDLSTVCAAYRDIDKCGQDRYMASAVTITIKNINVNKNTIVEEVAISDGLSPDTIEAIKRDIKRGYDITMSYPHNKIKEVTDAS
jgi:hypothetical protein